MTRRLVIGFGGAFFVLSLVSFAVLYAVLSTHLRTQRAQLLQDRVGAVASLLKSPAHGLEELRERVEREWPYRGGEHIYIEVRDRTGQLITSSPRMPAVLLQAFDVAKPGPAREVSLDGEGGGRFLVTTVLLENALGFDGLISVRLAVGNEQSEGFLRVLREVGAAVLALTLLVSLLAGAAIARREMKPLAEIAAQVARIDPENLSARVTLVRAPRELIVLTSSFNHSLERLSDSFERLTRFSSDLAHELRTPLSNMMGALEVALSRERSEENYREILTSNLEECGRVQAIVDSLLFLARAQNAGEPLRRQLQSLRTAVSEVVEFYEPLASERRIDLVAEDIADVEFEADPVLFQRALGNLLANAIQYTAAGGHIAVTASRRERELFVEVGDNGVGIAAEHVPKIFDRFYRVDASRTMASGGTGLGLSIVKTVMDLHGGRVLVESTPGSGSRFTLVF